MNLSQNVTQTTVKKSQGIFLQQFLVLHDDVGIIKKSLPKHTHQNVDKCGSEKRRLPGKQIWVKKCPGKYCNCSLRKAKRINARRILKGSGINKINWSLKQHFMLLIFLNSDRVYLKYRNRIGSLVHQAIHDLCLQLRFLFFGSRAGSVAAKKTICPNPRRRMFTLICR